MALECLWGFFVPKWADLQIFFQHVITAAIRAVIYLYTAL